MSKLGKMVKNMVKAKKESVMGKLGDSPYEDPMEPWSAKYNQPVKEETLAEDSILYRYIRSKGYSPEHMDFAHRSAFARSRAFKSYKVLHQKTLEKPQGGLSDIIVQKEEVVISEAGVGKLMNFIKAKGLDPTSMDGNQKKNYSGSSEYRVFKVLHPEDPKKQLLQDKKKKLKETSGMGERGEDWADATDEPFVKVKAKSKKLKEEADAVDTVTMDIPLLIRVLEFAREDAKTDMDLHKVVENLIKMRGDGTLSMQSYAKIVAIKEHLESLDELSKKTLMSYQHKASVSRGQNAIAAIKSKDSDRTKYVSLDKKRTKGLDAVRARIDAKNKADAAKNMDHPREPIKSKYPLGGRDEKPGRSYSEEVESLDEISKKTAMSYLTKAGKELDKGSKTPQKRDKRIDGYWNASKRLSGEKPTSEAVEELSELSKETLKSYVDKVSTGPSRGKTQTGTLKSIKAIGGVTKAIRKQYEKPVNELKKQADNMDFDDHLTREEVENISELANKTLRSYIRKTRDNPERKVGNDRALKKHSERMEKDAASGKEYTTLGSITRKLKNKEYSFQKEATGPCWKGYMMVGSKVKAGKTVPNCVPSNRKNIVKSAAKKKIRESMYDWEKDDKGDNKKPNAKVIMKGGTTMTGKPRDTVEIEPVLKTRPNSASGGKPSV